jgi:putative lipoprotein
VRILAGAALLLTLAGCSGRGVAPPPDVPRQSPPIPAAADAAPTPAAAAPERSEEVEGPRSTLEGTVSYVSRIALTPEAIVQVELRDVSRLDVEAPVVARQVIRRPGQVPVAFQLDYDPSSILPGHVYAVSARIVDRGQLQFVTDGGVAVLADGVPRSADIVVVPVR